MRRLDRRTEEFLLGRSIRAALPAAVRDAFAGRRVMITGAGGSVGAELARQLALCGPSAIVLLDHAEYLLFRTAKELQDLDLEIAIFSQLADVSRPEDMTAACNAHRPEFVFHAAACKHVTVAEECIVPAVRTNVLGALHTARAARAVDARFILISTDKAAEPHSVMGATKRLAELAVLDGNCNAGAIAVRFGNVLGSSGSVVEIFMDAARAGRPLMVTDPHATRFFMTAAEAASLVLRAAISGLAGEIFWLDMGSPLRLGDLVERVLDVVTPAGARRSPITVVGLRAGEKRNEDLTTHDLVMEATDDPAIWRARQMAPVWWLGAALARLQDACNSGDAVRALTILDEAVVDYTPSRDAWSAARRSSAAMSPGTSPIPQRGSRRHAELNSYAT